MDAGCFPAAMTAAKAASLGKWEVEDRKKDAKQKFKSEENLSAVSAGQLQPLRAFHVLSIKHLF